MKQFYNISSALNKIDEGTEEIGGFKNIPIRTGLVKGGRPISLRSYKNSIGTGTYYYNEVGTGASLNISLPSLSGVILSIASGSVNDAFPSGTGARIIQVRGLNTDWDEITENILLNGQTKVNSTKTFIRVNEFVVVNVGSTGSNVGRIYISDSADTFVSGIPQTRLYRSMAINGNLSGGSTYSVPRGHTCHITNVIVSTDATEAKPVESLVNLRNNNLGIEYVFARLVFSSGVGEFPIESFGQVQEKEDLIVKSRAVQTSVNSLTLWLEGILINNSEVKQKN